MWLEMGDGRIVGFVLFIETLKTEVPLEMACFFSWENWSIILNRKVYPRVKSQVANTKDILGFSVEGVLGSCCAGVYLLFYLSRRVCI